jgi:phage gp36-like protein
VPAYATRTDLVNLGIAAQALEGVATGSQDAALLAASELADSYLGSRFTLPLTAWGSDLKRHVCSIAAWDLLGGTRGFNPEAGTNEVVRTRYEDAIRWLEQVAANKVTPAGAVDSSSPTSSRGPASAFVRSSPKRGW